VLNITLIKRNHKMIKFFKSFFGGSTPVEPAAPYKVEAPKAAEPEQLVQANAVATAVALDLETADMGVAPAKKPRAPRTPKAATPKVAKEVKAKAAPKAKVAAVKKAAPKKAAAIKAAPKAVKSKKA
jgi:hypothetical protein